MSGHVDVNVKDDVVASSLSSETTKVEVDEVLVKQLNERIEGFEKLIHQVVRIRGVVPQLLMSLMTKGPFTCTSSLNSKTIPVSPLPSSNASSPSITLLSAIELGTISTFPAWQLDILNVERQLKEVLTSLLLQQDNLRSVQSSARLSRSDIEFSTSGILELSFSNDNFIKTSPHDQQQQQQQQQALPTLERNKDKRIRARLTSSFVESPTQFCQLDSVIQKVAIGTSVKRFEGVVDESRIRVDVGNVMNVYLDIRWRSNVESMESERYVVVVERGTCFAPHETKTSPFESSAFGTFRLVTQHLQIIIEESLNILSPSQTNLSTVISFLASYDNLFSGPFELYSSINNVPPTGTYRLGHGLLPPLARQWRQNANALPGEEQFGWDVVQ